MIKFLQRYSYLWKWGWKNLLFFPVLGLICYSFTVKAEGTRQLQPAATDNGFIQIFDNNTLTRPFATYNSAADYRLNIHISNLGEKIYFGFNQPNNDVYFRIKDPLGNVVYGPKLVPTTGAGFISTHAQAVAGPNVINATGYNPLFYVPTMTGDYYIEFNPTSPTNITPSKRVFTYFDITVISATNTAITGRLWSKSWDFQCNSGNNPFVADLFIYTNDGVVTGVNFNGIKPFGFVVSSNSTGCTSTGNFANDRKSRNGNVNYPEFKIFLNDPDHIAYPTGVIGAITSPTTVTGCPPGPYCINVTTSQPGAADVLIDLNGVSGYQSGTTDVMISTTVTAGNNCISWNGKDGLGNTVTSGTIPVQVNYYYGLTNLPLYDAEFHPNGYKVYSVRPAAPVPLLRWDDSMVGGSTNLAGCPGNTGCHSWPQSGAGFGDVKTINTWWYINEAVDNATLTLPVLALTSTSTSVKCNGSVLGSASVNPTGGKSPYTYLWNTSPPQSTATAINLIAGNYTVTVTDACNTVKTSSVTVGTDPLITVDAGPDVTVCPGSPSVKLQGAVTGVAKARWSGGAGTFSPNDSTLNATYTPTAGESANPSLTLTLSSIDTNCPMVTDQMIINFTSPLVAGISSPTIVCYGAKATLSASATGGTSPYSYTWSSGENTSSISGKAPGTYTLTVKDNSYNSCQATASVTITENPQLSVSSSSGSITSCNVSTNITATPSGGTSPYSYSWSTGATTQTINVGSGTYSVTVTDNVGCTAVSSSTVNAVSSTLKVIINQPDTLCFGQTTTITAIGSGGFGGYTYTWNNGPATASQVVPAGNYCVRVRDAGGCIVNGCVTVVQDAQLTVSILNPSPVCFGSQAILTAIPSGGKPPYSYLWSTGEASASVSKGVGNYTVTIRDANVNACTSNASATVTQQADITLSGTSTNVSCYGGNDGSATAMANGGSGVYTYKWTTLNKNGPTVNGLVAGSYPVTVTDSKGCEKSGNVTVAEPTAIIVNLVSKSNVSCFGSADGSAEITVSGGTPGYIYNWGPSGGTSAKATALAAGNYTARVIDGNGCPASIDLTITQPDALAASLSTANVSCNGGSNGKSTVTVSGGTPGYTYSWSPTGGNSAIASGLQAGNYTVTISDARGCLLTKNTTVTEPALLAASIANSSNVGCFGQKTGMAKASVTGGTAPFTYLWTPYGGATSTANSLGAGNYTVTVRDALGCIKSANVTITENPKLNVIASPTTYISCESTVSISAIASGGSGNYSYLWSDGSTTTSTFVGTTGTYRVTVTDDKGCKTKDSVSVVALNSTLKAVIDGPDYICKGTSAVLSASAQPGSPPYSFQWNTGASSSSVSVTQGSYCLTVTDNDGCKNTACKDVAEDSALVVSINSDTICFGSLAIITPIITGGHKPFNYHWSTGETTSSVSKGAGVYSVTVTDSINCSYTASVTIVEAPKINLSFRDVYNSCYNDKTGRAEIVATGGVAPYTYLWSTGETSSVLTEVPAGVYKVMVTDEMQCADSSSVTIVEPAQALSTSISKTDVSCFGFSDGSAIVTVYGGSGPYDFIWWEASSTQNAVSNLKSGTYNVLISDAWGCQIASQVVIAEPQKLTSQISKTDVTCYGGSDGTASLLANGGTTPYSILWSTGASAANVTGLVKGEYTVRIQDQNLCEISDTIQISQPSPITPKPLVKNNSCSGNNDGSIVISATGGTGMYSFYWPVQNINKDSLNHIGAGTYPVRITDAAGCVVRDTFIVVSPAPLNIRDTVNTISCHGLNTGSISASVSGGTAPYSYMWNTGSSASQISGLGAGSYTLVVTDAKQCNLSKGFSITEPSILNLSITKSDVSCNKGSDGSAKVTVTGGTPPYTYSWNNGKTDSLLTGVGVGTYSVTVTDNKGCQASSSVTIAEPSALSGTITVKNASCYGKKDGSATLNISGGTTAYSYLWSPGGGTGTQAIGLGAGSYTATVTDQKGCILQLSAVIAQPDSLKAQITSVKDADCNAATNGAATVSVSGGTPGYTYLWNPTLTTTSTVTGLAAGNYTVRITDVNSCQTSASVTISQPSALMVNSTHTDISCYGAAGGRIDVFATGGTGAYSYYWTPGGNLGKSATGLTAGDYTITVSDEKGCTAVSSAIIQQPSRINIIPVQTNVSCNGSNTGTASVSVSGGTFPYTYLWSDGSSSAGITSLKSGIYSVRVTDNNGCKDSVSLFISEPQELQVSIGNSHSSSCYGSSDGSLTAVASGGVKPYAFAWSPYGGNTDSAKYLKAGTYTVTVTDSNGCKAAIKGIVTEPAVIEPSVNVISNVACYGGKGGSVRAFANGGTAPYSFKWADGSTKDTLANLTKGTYSVTITDKNGCTAAASVSLNQPDSLFGVFHLVSDVSCYGLTDGKASITVLGGTPGYKYSWLPSGKITAYVDSLSSGTYTVSVIDAKGCSTTVKGVVNQPQGLSLKVVDSTMVSCFGMSNGAANFTASGGNGGYVYSWFPSGGSSSYANGLKSGMYTVTVKDAKNCISTGKVVITQPDSLIATTSSSSNVSCFGGLNGKANIQVTGGTEPYQYLWSTGSTSASVTGLKAGEYSVKVTDKNKCTDTAKVTIIQPELLSAVNQVNNVSCKGLSDGSVTLNVTGGTSPYAYLWNTGELIAGVANKSVGYYSADITDANGCKTTSSAFITEPDQLTVSPTIHHVSCFGGNDGSISLKVIGGTPPYMYSWSNGSSSSFNPDLTAGNYTVTITDRNSCSSTQTYTLIEPSALIANVAYIKNVTCEGGKDGAAEVMVSGGTKPYSYSWSGLPYVTSKVKNVKAGTYMVKVTDGKSCETTIPVVVDPGEKVTVTAFPKVHTVSCDSVVSISAIASGGKGAYTYTWSNGINATSINVGTGQYIVYVTDSLGCLAKDTVSVIALNSTLAVSVTGNEITCPGGLSFLSLTVTPGFPPYSYSWTTGDSDTSVVVGAGDYCVTVTDSAGCTNTACKRVTDEEPMVVEVLSDTVCKGATGVLVGSVGGGIEPYSYSWSNGGNDVKTSGNTGSYILTITDSIGCSSTGSGAVNEADEMVLTFVTGSVSCFGKSDGSAKVQVSSGVPSYEYAWSTGSTTDFIQDVTSSYYILTVRDNMGCVRTDSVLVASPDSLIATAAVADVSCFGGRDGSASLLTSGGNAPYTYLWLHNGAQEKLIIDHPKGNYVAMTTDSKGCTTHTKVVISEPMPLQSTTYSTPVSCYMGSDGSAAIVVSGGNGGFIYNWNNLAESSAKAGNLKAGSYKVQVSDAKGCMISEVIQVPEPNPLVSVFYSSDVSPVSCYTGNNGSAKVSVAGGTEPYTYAWSDNKTSALNTGLIAGTYSVVIKDSKGCTDTSHLAITQPDKLTLEVNEENKISCNGFNDGILKAVPVGGTAPYIYNWSPLGGNNQVSEKLPAGSYFLTVTDNQGCISSLNYSFSEPDPLKAVIKNLRSVSCKGFSDGAASVSVSGGSVPYFYKWSPHGEESDSIYGLPKGNYFVDVNDVKGCLTKVPVSITEPSPLAVSHTSVSHINCFGEASGKVSLGVSGGTPDYKYSWLQTGDTLGDVSNLRAGIFVVVIHDSRNCEVRDTVTLTQPSKISTSFSGIKDILCYAANNGSAIINASGGVPAYTYKWTPGNYNTASVSTLRAGVYSVEVTDSKNCTVSDHVTLVQPDPLLASISGYTNVSCNGKSDGSFTIKSEGGVLPYNYVWSPSVSGGDNASGLKAGVYSVKVTDKNNCVFNLSHTVSEPQKLSASISKKNVTCFSYDDGFAQAIVKGGTAPFSYNWSPSGSNLSYSDSLSKGWYTVVVKDRNNCLTSAEVEIVEPSIISASVYQKKNVTCFNGNDGEAHIRANGGYGNYSFLWSPVINADSVAYGLRKGTYSVAISDSGGCKITETISITQPDSIVTTVSKGDTICIGQSFPLKSSSTGGTPSYTYNWDNGLGSGSLKTVKPSQTTTYTVNVTDAAGCPGNNSTVVVYVRQPLNVKLTVTDDTICVGDTSHISAFAGGGNGNYSYVWSNTAWSGAGPFDLKPVGNTMYYVTVSDNCGTKPVKDSVEVIVLTPPNPTIRAYPAEGCVPLTVDFELFQDPKDPELKYNWQFTGLDSSSLAKPSHTFTTPGTYQVKLAISNKVCNSSAKGVTDIHVYPLPIASFTTEKTEITVLGPPMKFIDQSVDAAKWIWNFGDGESSTVQHPQHIFKEVEEYNVRLIAISSHGCKDTTYKKIRTLPAFAFYVPNSFSPNGDRINDTFSGKGIGISRYEMWLFDRWGNEIYSCDSIEKPWDGRANGGEEIAQNDVYVYIINVWDFNGEKHEYHGHFSLIK